MRVHALGSNEIVQSYWLRVHTLDPWPLDEGPKPKSNESRLNLHSTIFKGKSMGSDPKKK
jgi:hypothetical protein